MSEKELSMSEVTQTYEQGVPLTAGQFLRQAREAAGLPVASLASALKVPVHKLEALEADDFAAFPDTVFMRALASSICRSLRLDPAPILDQLPRSELKGFAAQRMNLNAPIKARAGKSGGMVASSKGISRKALWSVAALLLAAGIVYFMPHGALDEAAVGERSPVMVDQLVEAIPAPAAALPAAQLEPALPVEPAAPAAALSEPTGSALVPAQPAAAEPASAPSSQAAAGVGSALLVFSATAPSWVQVKDARGAVALQKNLNAGESVQLSAALPVSVVVGRPDVTTLQVRGQAFELPVVARGSVARFEVK